MSGSLWKYSHYLDDEDFDFARREYITYKMANEYYGLGEKPIIRIAWKSGAVYKVGKKVLIKREIFEAYLRKYRRIMEDEKNV